MVKNILLIALLSLLMTGCFENLEARGGIQGKIYLSLQEDLGLSLDGTKVSVKGTNLSVVTDVNGNFYLKNLEAKKYTLSVSRDNFEPKELEVDIEKGKMSNAVDTLSYKYGVLKGRIKYGANSVKKAKVEIINSKEVTIDSKEVNELGIFSFTTLEPGDVTVVITSSGNRDNEYPILIEKSRTEDMSTILLSSNIGSIAGVVIPEYADVMGIKLDDIQVYIDNNTEVYRTSSMGAFQISDQLEGEHTLSFIKSGYQTEPVKIKVTAGDTTKVEVTMKMIYNEPKISLVLAQPDISVSKYNYYHSLFAYDQNNGFWGVSASQIFYLDLDYNSVNVINKGSSDLNIEGMVDDQDGDFYMLVSSYDKLYFSVYNLSIFELDVKKNICPIGFTKDGDYIYIVTSTTFNNNDYISDYKNNRLVIIDVKDKKNPKMVSSTEIQTAYNNYKAPGIGDRCITVSNGYAYISNGYNLNTTSGGISIYNVSNPEKPAFLKSILTGYDVTDLRVYKGGLYIVSYSIKDLEAKAINYYLDKYDISDPKDPKADYYFELDLPFSDSPDYAHMKIINDFIYVHASNKLNIYRIYSDGSASGLKNITMPNKEIISGITANKKTAFIASGKEIKMLNIAFMYDISLIDSNIATSNSFNRKVCRLGNYIIYADDIQGIKVFDISKLPEKENTLVEDRIKEIVEKNKSEKIGLKPNRIYAINIYENKLFMKTVDKCIVVTIDKEGVVKEESIIDFEYFNSYNNLIEIGPNNILAFSKYSRYIDVFENNTNIKYKVDKQYVEDRAYVIVDDYYYYYGGKYLAVYSFKDTSLENIINFEDYRVDYTNGEIKIIRKGDYLYLSNYNSDIIKIIYIKDRANPKLIKEVLTGVKRISSLAADNYTLYIGDEGESNKNAITAVDIRNPFDAKVAKKSSLPGMVMAITLDDKYLYALMRGYGLVIFEK